MLSRRWGISPSLRSTRKFSCFLSPANLMLMTFICSGMGHSACPREMDDVEDFLKDCLPALGEKDGKSEL